MITLSNTAKTATTLRTADNLPVQRATHTISTEKIERIGC